MKHCPQCKADKTEEDFRERLCNGSVTRTRLVGICKGCENRNRQSARTKTQLERARWEPVLTWEEVNEYCQDRLARNRDGMYF